VLQNLQPQLLSRLGIVINESKIMLAALSTQFKDKRQR